MLSPEVVEEADIIVQSARDFGGTGAGRMRLDETCNRSQAQLREDWAIWDWKWVEGGDLRVEGMWAGRKWSEGRARRGYR